MFAKYRSYLEEIDYLESRVNALEDILRSANIVIPQNFAPAIIDSITTAQASVEGRLLPDANEPDNDQLFREMLIILENDNGAEAGSSN